MEKRTRSFECNTVAIGIYCTSFLMQLYLGIERFDEMKKLVILLYGLYTIFTYIFMGILIMIWQQKDKVMVGRDCIIFWSLYGLYCFIIATCWWYSFRKISEISGKNRRRFIFIGKAFFLSVLGYKMINPIFKYGVLLDRKTMQNYGVELRWMFTFFLLYIVNIWIQKKV